MNNCLVRLKFVLFLLSAITINLCITSCESEDSIKGDLPSQEIVKDWGGQLNYYITIGNVNYYPIVDSCFEYTIPVPADAELDKLVASFSANVSDVFVNEVRQIPDVTVNDFSDFKNGLRYTVYGKNDTVAFTVRVLPTSLPVVSVTTPNQAIIDSKEKWIVDSRFSVIHPDGTKEDYGVASVKGRGNTTWTAYPKKPYAIKLDEKKSVLGMPKHKRWVLLALYRGFIGNDLMFNLSKISDKIGWSPSGKFVELVLNGKYEGLYYLCEQIRVDKNRVNITEIKETDVTYPDISGGFLLEYDELYDEDFKFRSPKMDLPVNLKSPDSKVMGEQLNYIKDFIGTVEDELLSLDAEASQESKIQDLIDYENFADYWIMLELLNNYEAYKPRSVYMNKGRDGVDSDPGTIAKLKAGPLWDLEVFFAWKWFQHKDSYYFKYLFKDPVFVETVKNRWAIIYSKLNKNEFEFLKSYTKNLNLTIEQSARRDLSFWDNEYVDYDADMNVLVNEFIDKVKWMDEVISQF